MQCKQCGKSNIEVGVKLGMSTEPANFGPKYSKSVFIGTAPAFCDLCLDCGEINRIYIKSETNKKWLKK